MPKSRNRRDHKKKLANYKLNKKKEQEALKKKMIEEYMKLQQEAMAAQEAHTSTQEVEGPEINIDELNQEWNTDVDINTDIDINVDNSLTDSQSDDNNNEQ